MHAEDVGWPPKKADKTINANTNSKLISGVDFAAAVEADSVSYAAAA
ncbi:hypothetical protein pah_c254o009 [Parachlamydia acanthamoebae str. Hall's coccus]|nr:hypothetical protein pah_c254o009 [Parachlamydia acanthamoebae str. Hall's coccus]